MVELRKKSKKRCYLRALQAGRYLFRVRRGSTIFRVKMGKKFAKNQSKAHIVSDKNGENKYYFTLL
jgi:hypothetical protein